MHRCTDGFTAVLACSVGRRIAHQFRRVVPPCRVVVRSTPLVPVILWVAEIGGTLHAVVHRLGVPALAGTGGRGYRQNRVQGRACGYRLGHVQGGCGLARSIARISATQTRLHTAPPRRTSVQCLGYQVLSFVLSRQSEYVILPGIASAFVTRRRGAVPVCQTSGCREVRWRLRCTTESPLESSRSCQPSFVLFGLCAARRACSSSRGDRIRREPLDCVRLRCSAERNSGALGKPAAAGNFTSGRLMGGTSAQRLRAGADPESRTSLLVTCVAAGALHSARG